MRVPPLPPCPLTFDCSPKAYGEGEDWTLGHGHEDMQLDGATVAGVREVWDDGWEGHQTFSDGAVVSPC